MDYRSASPTTLHKWLTYGGAKFGNWYPPLGNFLSRWSQRIWEGRAKNISTQSSSVILSAGGFAFNRDMVQKFAPAYIKSVPLGTIGDDGKAITMGMSAGGAIGHMDRMTTWRFLSPPPAFLEGIGIGFNGQRIGNEDLYGATFSESLVHNHQGKGYLIVDHDTWTRGKEEKKTKTQPFQNAMLTYIFTIGHKKANTLKELAEKINLSSPALQKSVEEYNVGVKTGDDAFHKLEEYHKPINKAPFYAVDISVDASPFFPANSLSLGGLVVDEYTGAVLNEEGLPIEGLYAAGRTSRYLFQQLCQWPIPCRRNLFRAAGRQSSGW